jgi:hypothetical protein
MINLILSKSFLRLMDSKTLSIVKWLVSGMLLQALVEFAWFLQHFFRISSTNIL